MRIVGVMSGTSYDGIEVAVGEFRPDGDVLVMTPLGELSVGYGSGLRNRIAGVLPPNRVTIEQVCVLDTLLGQAFGAAARRAVDEIAGGRVDLVVSHGQTVFHWVEDRRARGTLQLGAPAWLASAVGVPVLSDLRTADIATGGQGAPLVPMFDALVLGGDRPRVALNLGGIANVTVVGPGRAPIGYDVGPANALIDAAALRWYGEPFDAGGRHAAAGRVDERLLAVLLAEPYYAAPPPKSTGKELFTLQYLEEAIRRSGATPGPDEVLATVTELTARTVAAACATHGVEEVVASGGGVRNPELMRRLAARVPRLTTSADLGVPPQAKEAYAFALLGWLSWHGLPGALPSVTGAAEAAVLGSITLGREARRNPPGRLKVGSQDVGGRSTDTLGGHER
ncbi:anhydro-N-acetylmuramic acid kinase [Rhizomonospora bruguierae]|uniref:anhydro-N-acetylmuramic acid kinase n=1 Tax=Rhizomonospora bruguierae TaxID=1581705 RepID=UPI001BCFE56F|nr:anhydro-N-acetylmuramic acid kinase [Micromonospora sp. NBRC 107566]